MAKHHRAFGIAVADGFPPCERASIRKELTVRVTGFVRRVLLALHESRRRQGERELRRCADIVDYARTHALALDERRDDAGWEAGSV